MQYATLNEAKIDWVTYTTRSEPVWNEWLLAFSAISQTEKLKGNETKQARLLGYVGQQCRTVFIGHRPDGYIVRVSGELADDWALLLYHAESRCTRIDLQATWQYATGDDQRMERLYSETLKAKSATGRPINVSRVQNRLITETIYIGRRASEKFFRIYDKGVEQQVCEAGKLIRWEGEYKGDMAQDMAYLICGEVDRETAVAHTLAREMHDRKCPYPSESSHAAILVNTKHIPGDLEQSMAWLSGPVATVVRRATNEIGPERVARALFSRVIECSTDEENILRILLEAESYAK